MRQLFLPLSPITTVCILRREEAGDGCARDDEGGGSYDAEEDNDAVAELCHGFL